MKTEIFTICDAATDAGGKLNMLGSFDTIAGRESPLVHPACSIVAKLRFDASDEGTHSMEIRITDPDGKPIVPPIKNDIQAPAVGNLSSVSRNFILNIQHLKLPEFGEYAIGLMIDGQERASVPLYVVQAKQQQPA